MVFLYSHWLKTNINTRHLIAAEFGIIKRGSTEVFNNEVLKDGYLIPEVESALNIDRLQTFLATNITDFEVLYKMLTDKFEGKETVPFQEIKVVQEKPILTEENVALPENTEETRQIKRRGRPRKVIA